MTDEFFCSPHSFTIIKDGLKVELTLWQDESLVAISIYQESNPKPFIEFNFIVRDKIKFLNEKASSQLIFCDCVFVENRFWRNSEENELDFFNTDKIRTKTDFVLSTYPKLEFRIT